MERMGWVEMGWEGCYRMGWDGTLLLDGQDVDTRGAHRSPCPPLEGDVLGVELGGDDGGREPPHHLLLRGLHSSQQHLLVVAGQGQRLRVDHPPVVVDLHHHGAGVCGERAVGAGTAPVRPPPLSPHPPGPRLTLPAEDEAAVAPLPGHMVKAQQRGVHPQVLAALPHLVRVAGADLGHQRHWGETAIAQPGTGPPCVPRVGCER